VYCVPCQPDPVLNGYGDSICDTLDEAVKEAEIVRREWEAREKRKIEEERQRIQRKEEQRKREDLHGYIDHRPPIQKGRITLHMQKVWRFLTLNYKAMTMRDFIHQAYLQGNAETSIREYVNSRGRKRAEPRLLYYVNREDVGKIAYEYLQYLIKNKIKIEA